ncbi:MAG: hypothetical protein P8X57_06720, partial [Cyclobacteriaceae bacterium]
VASQLPLTMDGSGQFTEVFYKNLLNGEDVRLSIHRGRKSLFDSRTDHHDFVSLVGYVQLPENYGDFLYHLKLKNQFAQVNVLKKWVDHVIRKSGFNEQTISIAREQFDRHVGMVEEYYHAMTKSGSYARTLMEEMTGLLASACKTRAELEFHYAKESGKDEDDLSLKYLEKAREYYKEGFRHNYSAHWNGMQFISLNIVTQGEPEKPVYWDIIELVASEAAEDPDDYWALGTLAELYLLAPIAKGKEMTDKAKNAIQQFLSRLEKHQGKEFAKSSLLRQLRKYEEWWTQENGYFPGCSQDLSAAAKDLIQFITKKDDVKSIVK